MDPISIASIVLTTAKICLSTTKFLYDLQEKYQDAPLILVSVCSETNVISASLAHLRSLLLQREHIGQSQPELLLLDVLDQALTGCKVVFGCLELELRRIASGSGEPGPSSAAAGWRARARLIWNEKRLNELLGALRGQQTAITLVIQLFQVNALSDIREILQNRQETIRAAADMTESLRSANPSVRVASSIYENEDYAGSEGPGRDSLTPSDVDFDFDDEVVSGRVYRRVLAQARASARRSTLPGIEELPVIANPISEGPIQNDGPAAQADDFVNLPDHPTAFDLSFQEPMQPRVEELIGVQAEEESRIRGSETTSELTAEATSVILGQKPQMNLVELPKRATRVTIRTSLLGFVRGEEVKRCASFSCGKRLTGAVLQLEDGNYFHSECFQCLPIGCKKLVSDAYYKHDSLTRAYYLCELHHFQKIGHCGGCGMPVEKDCREVTLRSVGKAKFHADHFRADCCGVVFKHEDRFYEHLGGFYCKKHFCVSCEKPIETDDSSSVSERFGGEGFLHWGCDQLLLMGPE